MQRPNLPEPSWLQEADSCAALQVAEKRQILSLEVGDTEELGTWIGYRGMGHGP